MKQEEKIKKIAQRLLKNATTLCKLDTVIEEDTKFFQSAAEQEKKRKKVQSVRDGVGVAGKLYKAVSEHIEKQCNNLSDEEIKDVVNLVMGEDVSRNKAKMRIRDALMSIFVGVTVERAAQKSAEENLAWFDGFSDEIYIANVRYIATRNCIDLQIEVNKLEVVDENDKNVSVVDIAELKTKKEQYSMVAEVASNVSDKKIGKKF